MQEQGYRQLHMRADIRSIHTCALDDVGCDHRTFGTGARPGATNMVNFSVAYGGGVMNSTRWRAVPRPAASPHLF